MKLLITGATGFLGSRLVEFFVGLEDVKCIIATGRKFSYPNQVIHLKVKYLLGDLQDVNFVKRLFVEEVDVVINCASLSSPWGAFSTFYKANVVTQKHLIEESLRASVKRFVYISSPSIYFNFKDSIGIREDTILPKKMVNNYAKTKWEAECLLRQSNLPFVILRPRALIGRGDTVIMPRLIRAHLEKKLKIIGNGQNVVDLTSVINMTEAVRCAIYTSHYNESYNISNGEPINLWKSINDILSAIGIPKVTNKMPYRVLLLVAQMMEIKARFVDGEEPVLTKYSVGVLAKSFTFDITKAKEKLKYHPQQSTSEAIEEFAKWYKKRDSDQS